MRPPPPAAHPCRRRIGHHDARRGLAAHLARFFDGLLDGDLHRVGEFVAGVFERARLELERQRQHAGRRQQLGLAGVQHGREASSLPSLLTGTRRRSVPALRSVKISSR